MSAALRVLIASDVYFPRINGVSTSIETFRRALAACDIELRLVVPRYGDEPDAAGILRVRGRPVPGDPEDRIVGWRSMRDTAVAAAADCHLVHIQTPFVAHWAGLAAARRHGLPLLTTYHTFFEEYLHHYAPLLPGSALRALARRVSRHQCNAADAVVVPSSAMHDRLATYGVRTPMHVVPTGIPVAAFGGGDRQRFRSRHGISEDAPMALYVGRVAHEKNIGFLIEAAARIAPRLPGFVLVIAGEGPALPALRAAADNAACGCVRFVGYLDRVAELPDCYAAADAFAFASRTETQGLVLLEAMAAGQPVVALSAMGTADILHARRGAIVPPDEVGAFSEALLALLRDPTLRRKLSTEATTFAHEWHEDAMAERLAAVYRGLASRTGNSSARRGPNRHAV